MSTLNDKDRDNLAAFLDGELDEEASQELEAKLNRDPQARQEVDALRRAWSMLDYLPRPEPSPTFTRRTLERLTLALPQSATTARMPGIHRGGWLFKLAWAGALLLGLTLGAVAGNFLWQFPEKADRLAETLAQQGGLIQRLNLYEPLIDVQFLKSLDQPELFGEGCSDYREAWTVGRATSAGDSEAPATPRSTVHAPRPMVEGEARSQAAAFLALPAARQQQLVGLEHDVETSGVRDRLLAVAQRFQDWFDHLEPKERDKVMNELDSKGRLAVVADLRNLQWLAHQPKAQRELFATLSGEARADLIKKLRQEEAQHQRAWQIAIRFWDERHSTFRNLKQLPRDVQDYFHEYLLHMLSPDEKARLDKAEGQWPLFLQTLVELADRHPPALGGPNGKTGLYGPKTYAELPREVKERLNLKKMGKELKAKEGIWPVFAVAVSDLAHRRGVTLPNELWATDHKCLTPPMREFVEKKLIPVLTDQEVRKLTDATSKWPNYPHTIQELANAHKLQPPWFTLPGPRERWDIYRLQKGDNPDGPR